MQEPTKLLRITKFLASIAVGFGLLGAVRAQADLIVQPVSVTTTSLPADSGRPLVNMINQLGLTGPYVSGVTDFTSFTNTTTHNSTNGIYRSNANRVLPGVLTFDLGSELTIDRMAMWNSALGGEEFRAFGLFSDDDNNFGNGGTVSLGSFEAQVIAGDPAQIFDFTNATTRYVHLQLTSGYNDPLSRVSTGEIAFSAIPEPSSFLFLGVVGTVAAITAVGKAAVRAVKHLLL